MNHVFRGPPSIKGKEPVPMWIANWSESVQLTYFKFFYEVGMEEEARRQ